MEQQFLTINDIKYTAESITEAAREYVDTIQKTDALIASKRLEMQLLGTARETVFNALLEEAKHFELFEEPTPETEE